MRLDLLQNLRQRRNLDETDMSQDAQILAMLPSEKLSELCGWELGDTRWAYVFMDWARECGFSVTTAD